MIISLPVILTSGIITISGISIFLGNKKYNIITFPIKKYQHNKSINIGEDTYKYVSEYRKQLLSKTAKLLKELDVRYCISHGNLIEYERKQPIFHDDDIDIRICIDDLYKFEEYYKSNKNNNLEIQFSNPNKQLKIKQIKQTKWQQLKLINFENTKNIKIYNNFHIHLDLVSSDVSGSPWIKYDIDFNNLREIKYLGVNTFAPNKEDTLRVLKREYGPNYMKANRKYSFDVKRLVNIYNEITN